MTLFRVIINKQEIINICQVGEGCLDSTLPQYIILIPMRGQYQNGVLQIMFDDQQEASLEGGLTFWMSPPWGVMTRMENSLMPSRSDMAYLKVPVMSVQPSLQKSLFMPLSENTFTYAPASLLRCRNTWRLPSFSLTFTRTSGFTHQKLVTFFRSPSLTSVISTIESLRSQNWDRLIVVSLVSLCVSRKTALEGLREVKFLTSQKGYSEKQSSRLTWKISTQMAVCAGWMILMCAPSCMTCVWKASPPAASPLASTSSSCSSMVLDTSPNSFLQDSTGYSLYFLRISRARLKLTELRERSRKHLMQSNWISQALYYASPTALMSSSASLSLSCRMRKQAWETWKEWFLRPMMDPTRKRMQVSLNCTFLMVDLLSLAKGWVRVEQQGKYSKAVGWSAVGSLRPITSLTVPMSPCRKPNFQMSALQKLLFLSTSITLEQNSLSRSIHRISLGLKMFSSKMFLLWRKLMTSSFLPERITSSKDSSLLTVHAFLTVMGGRGVALAMMVEPLEALLGQMGQVPSSGMQKCLSYDLEEQGSMRMLMICVYSWLLRGMVPLGMSSSTCNSRGVPEVLLITVWQMQHFFTMNSSTSFSYSVPSSSQATLLLGSKNLWLMSTPNFLECSTLFTSLTQMSMGDLATISYLLSKLLSSKLEELSLEMKLEARMNSSGVLRLMKDSEMKGWDSRKLLASSAQKGEGLMRVGAQRRQFFTSTYVFSVYSLVLSTGVKDFFYYITFLRRYIMSKDYSLSYILILIIRFLGAEHAMDFNIILGYISYISFIFFFITAFTSLYLALMIVSKLFLNSSQLRLTPFCSNSNASTMDLATSVCLFLTSVCTRSAFSNALSDCSLFKEVYAAADGSSRRQRSTTVLSILFLMKFLTTLLKKSPSLNLMKVFSQWQHSLSQISLFLPSSRQCQPSRWLLQLYSFTFFVLANSKISASPTVLY